MNLAGAELIDLSVSLGPSASEHVPVNIEYLSHAGGGAHLAELTGVRQQDLCGGLGWASERITAITHSGTHVDAPFHYAPECRGEQSRTIDVMPLEWFIGSALCIDVSRGQDAVTPAEAAEFEKARGIQIAHEIVLFHTGAAVAYGTASYGDAGRPLAPQLVAMLCERGVRVIGTDAWSIDPPLAKMRANAVTEGGKGVWQAHYVGRHHEFCIVEKLTHLDRLPPSGFIVVCFPVKVAKGSAGWTRAVAILPKRM